MNVPFKLNETQLQASKLLAGPQRHTLLVGGARSGKTFTLVRRTIIRARRAPYSRHVILRRHANAAHRTIAMDTMPKVLRLCFPGLEFVENKQDGYFLLPDNKAEIWIAGLDDGRAIERILGAEYATLYLNECSEIEYESVALARTRLAQRVVCDDAKLEDGTVVTGQVLPLKVYYDLNPGGSAHWTYSMFIRKLDPVTRDPLAEPDEYQHMFMNPYGNAANLDPAFFKELQSLPARQRKRFLEGEYTSDVDGALWTLEMLDQCRCRFEDMPDLVRVIVAVDPSGHTGEEGSKSDTIGICVAGRGTDGHAYVLEDATMSSSPEVWGRKVVELYNKYKADCVVMERNFGGDLTSAVIRAVDITVPVIPVTASRGKAVRAAPVAACYEEGRVEHQKPRVFHVGDPHQFRNLESELLLFTTTGFAGKKSPGAADSLVWAVSDLLLGAREYTFSFA